MDTRLVEVALPVPSRRTYTYEVPPDQAGRARIGSRALVPLGRSQAVGLIVATPPAAGTAPGAVRPVIDLPDDRPVLTTGMLELTRWGADYYLCSWGEMIRAALPGGMSVRPRRRWRLTEAGRERAESLLPGAGGARESLLRALLRAGGKGLAHQSLLRHAGRGGGALVEALASGGEIEALEGAPAASRAFPAEKPGTARAGGGTPTGPEWAGPSAEGEGAGPRPPRLTTAQQGCLDLIRAAFDEPAPAPLLLHGVTGSGKTEVYLRAVAVCLERGGSALYLVPEIGLTPLLGRIIRARFGERVAVLHSALSPAERRREWLRIQTGRAPVVLGPRSAVFAPLGRLGLVVIDEEQDPSYKQAESPRYNGRDLALVRARREGAVAILGSATPSLEAWHNARSGKYRLLELPERVGSRPMPRIDVVDLREEFRETGRLPVLSGRLVEALRECTARGEQAVVLINRRGYAPFLLCRSCGRAVGCKRCSVSLVLHGARGRDQSLRCHYCGARRARPVLCPECRSEHLQPVGEGSERVETYLRREIPGARVARMDSDTVRGRAAHEKILTAFERKEIDVLVGTQMVAKGHDFPAVTLVGVLLADGVLGLPDFRASERTWQLLTQAAGRAGRGDRPGSVIVQALRPDHYAITSAATHDAATFYDKEMRIRRIMRTPPFTVLAQVLSRSSSLERATDAARRAARAIRDNGAGRVQVLGPSPAPIARLRGSHRIQVLARSASRRRLGAALSAMLDEAAAGRFDRLLSVDVDPLSLL